MAMKRIAAMLLTSVLLLSCVGCAQDGRKEPGAEKADLGLTAEVKPATDFTAKANAAVYDELDFDDKQEYEFATRGLIDAPETLELKDEDGTILWSQEAYAFLDDYEKAHELHEKMGCICYENKEMGIYFINDPDGNWMEVIPKGRF